MIFFLLRTLIVAAEEGVRTTFEDNYIIAMITFILANHM